MIKFTVYGKPQPGGSKRAFVVKRRGGKYGASVVDANPNAKDWKASIAQVAREIYDGPLLDGPLHVSFAFFMPRGRSHFKKTGGLTKGAPRHHTSRPDALKLARLAEDALSSVLWFDDAQIVSENLFKCYGEPARVEVIVKEASEVEEEFLAECADA